MSSLSVHPIPILKDNYVWAIVDKKKQSAVIVDPGEAKAVHHFLNQNNLSLVAILITHHHADHSQGISELKMSDDALVFGPVNDYVAGITNPMHDKETVRIANFPCTFQVLAIPGHTLGHIAYYSPSMLFCGDTLFAAGCGRLFEGTPEQMFASLQTLSTLPDDTHIYCAHEYTLNNLRFAQLVEPNNQKIAERIKKVSEMRQKNIPSLPSTLAEEKATNPFLRCTSPELIANVEKYANRKLESPIQVFSWLRKWKDAF